MISLIWYLLFWSRMRRTPGVGSAFVVLLLLFFLLLLEALRAAELLPPEGRNRSRRLLKEYGDSGASMMVSQIMDWDWGVADGSSEEE